MKTWNRNFIGILGVCGISGASSLPSIPLCDFHRRISISAHADANATENCFRPKLAQGLSDKSRKMSGWRVKIEMFWRSAVSHGKTG